MILSATFSKPAGKCKEIFGKEYIKIRIWKNPAAGIKPKSEYEAEFFTQTQAFQKKMSAEEVDEFISLYAGTAFKAVTAQTEDEEITVMSNRHGEIKELRKPRKNKIEITGKSNRKKNYILKEGIPVPFLVKLGVMTKDGNVIAQKYDKFRQINRFLEFISDVIPDVKRLTAKEEGAQENPFSKERPLHIADFGCGKSYLTFALYHYLREIENLDVEITGLDLKADVIKKCSDLATELGYEGLHFYVGDVAEFSYSHKPDMIVTLHACDTATDYALDFAMRNNAKAILSVPCCQHEINLQLEKKHGIKPESPLSPLVRYGLIRERLSSLATDAMRAELLEQNGYSVDVLEFIDMEHTPKNILIRAVKNPSMDESRVEESKIRVSALLNELCVTQTLSELLRKKS